MRIPKRLSAAVEQTAQLLRTQTRQPSHMVRKKQKVSTGIPNVGLANKVEQVAKILRKKP